MHHPSNYLSNTDPGLARFVFGWVRWLGGSNLNSHLTAGQDFPGPNQPSNGVVSGQVMPPLVYHIIAEGVWELGYDLGQISPSLDNCTFLADLPFSAASI